MRSLQRVAITAGVLGAAVLGSSSAHAEPSAWVALGGGVLAWRVPREVTPATAADLNNNVAAVPAVYAEGTTFRIDPTMRIEAGIGMPDRYPVIVGGVFRVSPLLASNTGADMAWLVRACNRSFQVGGFGVALDVGVYARTWGVRSTGFEGSLTVGAPLGIAASFNFMMGTNTVMGFGGVVSLDLLRLTLYRKTFLNWWPNPEVNTHTAPTAAGSTAIRFF